MTDEFDYGLISNPEEAQRLGQILYQSFNSNDWPYYSNIIGQENFRVIRRAGEIAGGLAILQMGQWYGAQSIPMAGIASVAVLPEHRGTGIAVELLTHTLKELYAKGIPLSTLYAATQRPYRKVGYEQAGICCHFELPSESIRLDVGKMSGQDIRRLPIQPISLHSDVFSDVYQQWAVKNNGNLDRNQSMWRLLVESPNDEAIYAYLIGSELQPEGYVIFKQRSEDGNIEIRDWVVLTPGALRRLWTFLADHRSQVNQVLWCSSAHDPLLLLLAEQSDRIKHLARWMLRIVDVPKALEMRGYPVGIEAELHLDVRDNLLFENNGRFILTVSGRRGKVTQGGTGELQLDVRGLAPLYTGLFTPYQLKFTGQLEATDAALSVATQLFTGSEPWMSDRF